MNKKIAVFLIILCFCNLFGCTSSNAEKYPKITVTANGIEIPYYTLPNKWDGVLYDRLSAYQHAFEVNPEMENLIEVTTGDKINVDFRKNNPDKIMVEYELLTVAYYPIADNTASAVETIKTDFEANGIVGRKRM